MTTLAKEIREDVQERALSLPAQVEARRALEARGLAPRPRVVAAMTAGAAAGVLDLDDEGVGDACIGVVAGAVALRGRLLTVCRARNCRLSAAGVEVLARALPATVRDLDLARNRGAPAAPTSTLGLRSR